MRKVYDLRCKSLKKFYSSPKRWCKHQGTSNNGMACCLYGAALKFSVDADVIEKLKGAVIKQFPERIKWNNTAIIDFNDDSRTTFNDILSVVNEANV